MPARRFPPPWSVEETDACFIVRDANGEALAYVYFEEEPGGDLRLTCSPATRPSCRSSTSGLLWPGAGHPAAGRRPAGCR
jgi:hypothetical protein